MTQLSVLHLSTSDVDSGGARAAYRLHQGLQSLGVSSQMLVRAKFSSDRTVIPEKSILTKLGPPLSNIPLKLYSRRPPAMFSVQWSPDVLSSQVGKLNPEVIHLHWVCNGFLQIETLAKFNRPLVWTLHDMWPFTGGCHYAENCIRYTEACGACPQLDSDRPRDLSHWVFQRKNRAWKKLNITIVSPSQWLANCARKSTLFQELPIKIIPHGVDLTKYKPVNQHLAREILNLPPTKKIILFGASPGTTGHSRKGSQFLQPALQKLSQSDWQSEWELAILGTSEPENSVNCSFKVSYLGSFRDDTSLALVYSAVDVVVVPSVQEAFGQIASEALACGTPVVAFAATGLKDIVDHQQNGYLAQPFDADDLAKGIAWVLEDEMRHQQLRLGARTKAEQEFDVRVQASRHLPIYGEKL